MNGVSQRLRKTLAGTPLEVACECSDSLGVCADEINRLDARIAELEQSVTIRDTEIARLETDLELARRDHASALLLVADIRFALGDNGKRMQAELVEYCKELRAAVVALRGFAQGVMDSWPHGDVDGYELERMAVAHGLLALKYPKPTEPCGENCACSGYPTPKEWAEGIDCYAKTPLLTGKIDEARAGNGCPIWPLRRTGSPDRLPQLAYRNQEYAMPEASDGEGRHGDASQ